jgi:hypothetical protein
VTDESQPNPAKAKEHRKPVLASIPANFADLPADERKRFIRDLTDQIMGTFPPDRQPYRPDGPTGDQNH